MDWLLFILLISAALHLVAVVLIGVLLYERGYWMREAEAQQTDRIQLHDRIRALKADVEESHAEILEWEKQTAELQFGSGNGNGCCKQATV
jgi:hypothetical protein